MLGHLMMWFIQLMLKRKIQTNLLLKEFMYTVSTLKVANGAEMVLMIVILNKYSLLFQLFM